MKARVLLVDDEAAIASSLKVVLESKGHAVVTAFSTAEAISELGKHTFDLILTDLKMESDTAGYEVVRAARGQTNRPAIVILTAFPVAGREWRKLGAHAMVTKPVPVEDLLHTIDRLMARRGAHGQKPG